MPTGLYAEIKEPFSPSVTKQAATEQREHTISGFGITFSHSNIEHLVMSEIDAVEEPTRQHLGAKNTVGFPAQRMSGPG